MEWRLVRLVAAFLLISGPWRRQVAALQKTRDCSSSPDQSETRGARTSGGIGDAGQMAVGTVDANFFTPSHGLLLSAGRS